MKHLIPILSLTLLAACGKNANSLSGGATQSFTSKLEVSKDFDQDGIPNENDPEPCFPEYPKLEMKNASFVIASEGGESFSRETLLSNPNYTELVRPDVTKLLGQDQSHLKESFVIRPATASLQLSFSDFKKLSVGKIYFVVPELQVSFQLSKVATIFSYKITSMTVEVKIFSPRADDKPIELTLTLPEEAIQNQVRFAEALDDSALALLSKTGSKIDIKIVDYTFTNGKKSNSLQEIYNQYVKENALELTQKNEAQETRLVCKTEAHEKSIIESPLKRTTLVSVPPTPSISEFVNFQKTYSLTPNKSGYEVCFKVEGKHYDNSVCTIRERVPRSRIPNEMRDALAPCKIAVSETKAINKQQKVQLIQDEKVFNLSSSSLDVARPITEENIFDTCIKVDASDSRNLKIKAEMAGEDRLYMTINPL